jgi:hypothetical protein
MALVRAALVSARSLDRSACIFCYAQSMLNQFIGDWNRAYRSQIFFETDAFVGRRCHREQSQPINNPLTLKMFDKDERSKPEG